MKKPTNIKLDWRFETLEHLGEVHMKELWNFYIMTEEHFRRALQAWEKESEGMTEEEEAMNADYFIDRRHGIESLLDRGHTLGILGVYTFLERFLNQVAEYLHAAGAPFPEPKQGLSLNKVQGYLASVGIDLKCKPFDWEEMERLREVRNCIAHTDGWITDDFARRLTAVGIKARENTRLQLHDKYFESWWVLVNDTYQHVLEQCWKKFGHEDKGDDSLRPHVKFSSDKLREILQEATDAGIAAREQATKRLLADAKRTIQKARGIRKRLCRILDSCEIYPRRGSDVDIVSFALFLRMCELHETV